MYKFRSLLFFCALIFFSMPLYAQKDLLFNRKMTLLKDKIRIDYTFSAESDVKAMFAQYKIFFHQCGMPLLPKMNECVALPKKALPVFKVVSQDAVVKNFVIQQSSPVTIDSDQIVDTVCAPNYWQINRELPSNSGRFSSLMELHSLDLFFYEIYPFQYNPQKRELTINTHISVEIELNSAFLSQLDISALDYLMVKSAINYSSIEKNLRSVVDTFPNYIIVTHPDFNLAANKLALWKSQQGFKTFVYQHSMWNSDSIRNLMLSLYQNEQLRPQFLVLLGDTGFVPSVDKIAPPPIPEIFSSDLYYTTMDSDTDFVSNFSVGRISVATSLEANTVVDKLIQFQKKPPMLPSYYQKMVNCSYFQDDNLDGYDDRRFVQTSEEVRNYIQTNFSKNVIRIYEAGATVYPQFWNNDDYSAGEPIGVDLLKPTFAWNGSSSDIVNAINQGSFLVMHRDHGYSNASGWAHPSLGSSQLPFLTNDSLLPLVFSVNCYSGNYRVAESFAERLIRQKCGASGVFAPSYYSYSGNNDAFLLGLYDALFPIPGLSANFTGSGGNHSSVYVNHNPINKPGDMLRHAVWYMNYNWGVNLYSSEIAHFQGDPAMPVITNVPLQMVANHKDTIDCIDSVITVYVANSSGFVATLTVDNQVIARSYFHNDSAQLNFTPQYGVEAILTISGDLYAPYISPIYWFCSQPIYKPKAGFIVSDTLLCNNMVVFTDTSLFEPSSWNWNFGDGESSAMQNPMHQYSSSGIYQVSLVVSNIHGIDTIVKNNLVHVFMPPNPSPVDTMLCRSIPIQFAFSESDSMVWFSNATSPQVVAWGNSILLMADTLLYRAVYLDMPTVGVGKIDTTGVGGFIYQNREHYLTFNALSDLVINSVDIYALSASSKVIKIVNQQNQIVATKNVSVHSGKNTVQLDFFVPQGTGYRLVAPAYCSWYANFNITQFPFLIHDLISIDSSSINPNYYCFYNWQIQKRCYSHRVSVEVRAVQIDTSLSVAGDVMWCNQLPFFLTSDTSAMITWNNGTTIDSIMVSQPGLYCATLEKNHCLYQTDSLQLHDYAHVSSDFDFNIGVSSICFNNLSSNAYDFLWDFGDGSFSQEVSPCHQFLASGNFDVKLLAMNNCDTSSVQKNIVIQSIKEELQINENLFLSPNPTTGGVDIVLSDDIRPSFFNVYDIHGKWILGSHVNSGIVFFDMSAYSAGIYIVEIVCQDDIKKMKLLKVND